MGEVDLIARRGKMVAFIEVKARTSAADLDFAIDERRLSRVAAAARTLAAKYARPGDDMRIDVKIGRASRRGRVCKNVYITVVAVSLKKKNILQHKQPVTDIT